MVLTIDQESICLDDLDERQKWKYPISSYNELETSTEDGTKPMKLYSTTQSRVSLRVTRILGIQRMATKELFYNVALNPLAVPRENKFGVNSRKAHALCE